MSVSTGKLSHKRTKSASERVDRELYPLSSTLRPASRDSIGRRSSESSSRREHHSRSRSISSEYTDEKIPVLRPRKNVESRPDSFSRDSLCDSLYEPTFSIPSATKLRRDKMARVCKLLGEDVPVDLVFPANADPEDDGYCVLDICAPQKAIGAEAPPPIPPKSVKKSAEPSQQKENSEQPRWMSYRTPILETIVEQSPRASYSSSSSADSACSLLTTTTSSSYRFTSSGCASESSPASSSAQVTTTSASSLSPAQQIREMSSTHGRREFAIYVPFRRRMSGQNCHAEFYGKEATQDFEVVRGMLDLRV